MKRRNFLRNDDERTLSVLSPITQPEITYASGWKDDLQTITDNFEQRLTETKEALKKRVPSFFSRMNAFDLAFTHQQLLLSIIFLLLMISFAVDGGMLFFGFYKEKVQ